MLSSGKHILRLLNRRSRNGQSILIVAFAFMALIAFVGIAVDVALLFVRYSSLTRAVDAAAIAAAGQIREGTDYMTLQAVAQQFVKLQGNVNPDTVRVETCETEVYDYSQQWIKDNTPPGGPAPTPPPAKDVLQVLIHPPAPKHPSELCKENPQKLVRVSAQLNSPTTFLAILGWPSVLLEASAVSQTAVLDVALVIDISWSQAYDTYFDQSTSADLVPGGTVNYPIPIDPGTNLPEDTNEIPLRSYTDFTAIGLAPYDPATVDANGVINGTSTAAIRPECTKYDTTTVAGAGFAANYAWGGCCNDPATQGNPPTSPTDPGNVDPGRRLTGDLKSPYSTLSNGDPDLDTPPVADYDPDWYIYDAPNLPSAKIQYTGKNMDITSNPNSAKVLSGKPDGNYSDLLCRPFKDVRDAARRFIKRLDFVRGDRLTLVTFGADTKALYPRGQTIPVITEKKTAIRTLNEKVGVEVNPNGFQFGCITDSQTTKEDWRNWREVNNYWRVAQCRDTNMGGGIRAGRSALTNPDWIRRDSVWVMVLLSDGYPNRTPSFNDISSDFSIPGPEHNWLVEEDRPDANNIIDGITLDKTTIQDYCGNPLNPMDPVNDPNGEGALWNQDATKMQTLGMKPQLCVPPYWGDTDGVSGFPAQPWGLYSSANNTDVPVWSFGFCPWYTFCNNEARLDSMNPVLPQCTAVDDPSMWYQYDPRNKLIVNGVPTSNVKKFEKSKVAPFCIDWNPDTRHFCSDAEGIINSTNAYCDTQYDPDDYARDQADFSGLIDYTSKTKGSFIAMFGIFFSHKMGNTDYVNDNILGIKFLRYLADAGDNGVIDNVLQKWYRIKHEERVISANALLSPWVGEWAPTLQVPNIPASTSAAGLAIFTIPDKLDPNQAQADPCDAYDYREKIAYPQRPGIDTTYEDLATHDCGQFWYASNITKVNDAFTEIAGRLFTRLSR